MSLLINEWIWKDGKVPQYKEIYYFCFGSLIYKIRENPEFFASLCNFWSGSSFFRIRENCWALKSRSWAGDLKIRENPLWRRILENEGEFWARFKIRVKDEGSRFKILENELRKILEKKMEVRIIFFLHVSKSQ